MPETITKTEYRTLQMEVRDLKEKVVNIERVIYRVAAKRKEAEVLALAKEAEKLAEKGKLPTLKSLRELR